MTIVNINHLGKLVIIRSTKFFCNQAKKMKPSHPSLSVLPIALAGLCLLADPLCAQDADPSLIDRELAHGIDLRSNAFARCMGLPSCTVDGLTLSAERETVDGLGWQPAALYWDPIDGIGILDGAQNDEIDIDERLTVQSDTALTSLGRIWLSDLFLGEEKRYGALGNDKIEGVPDDVEVAGIALWSGQKEQARFIVTGKDVLPEDPFNQHVSGTFLEDGDLRRRLLLNNDIITVLSAGRGTGANAIAISTALGEVDQAKRGIFDGVETVEIDLSSILAGFRGTIMFLQGTHNFDAVQRLAATPSAWNVLRQDAVRDRSVGDWSNGELGVAIKEDAPTDKIVFFSPFDSSNDFSVAGFVTRKDLIHVAQQ
ncbi:hypothetical protein [Rhodobacter maris]|uniref:hypothetical protein n=1 Tax=Rhodobacter maris TaxID=446682 RepID=UPI000BE40F7E|nr:hypothetical protein [Rhodobacter maris]